MTTNRFTLDLAPMNFYQVMDHIKGITNELSRSELAEYHKGNRSPMDLDQVIGMVHGMVATAAESEMSLWVKSRATRTGQPKHQPTNPESGATVAF